jgi:hypothetical protein
MTFDELIATIVALPFCIAAFAWLSSGGVEHFTQ